MPQSKSASADTVQQARTKARQRLIGAVLLLLVGVVGFPLVFETQPRPIPVDVTIEIPRKDTAAPLPPPVSRAPPAANSVVASVADTSADTARSVTVAAPASAVTAPRPAAAPAVAASAPAAPVAPTNAVTAPGTETEIGRFVVQVGAFADAAAVQLIRGRAEKLGLKTYTQVAETVAGNRTRVRIGPFDTREAADHAAAKAKAGGLSAVVLTL
jgi:DedD protein